MTHHSTCSAQKAQNLRWPTWNLSFTARNRYGWRYGMMIVLVVSIMAVWGAVGGHVMATLNPSLAKIHQSGPPLDAWITPPASTHLPPIMIATPADLRQTDRIIDVPAGSTIAAHIADKTGTAPVLEVNGKRVAFVAEDQKDFAVTAAITDGQTIRIQHGWNELGSWRIRIVTDQAPQIALTEQPSVTERKSLRLPFSASDDYGVATVRLRVIPQASTPSISSHPFEVALSTAANEAKNLQDTRLIDLTATPWAGAPVSLQLIATDSAGHQSLSAPTILTLPERVFQHPVAHALIDERRKLLQSPTDNRVRNEAANLMAGVALHPANYRGDPVVLMALRGGAVRLILDREAATLPTINALLWQTAVRIEASENPDASELSLRDDLLHNVPTILRHPMTYNLMNNFGVNAFGYSGLGACSGEGMAYTPYAPDLHRVRELLHELQHRSGDLQ